MNQGVIDARVDFDNRFPEPLRPLVCGDGELDAGETCDDGNTTPGDGCSAGCQTE